VDEIGECEIVYEISSDDLSLYAFKKQLFLNDLQRYAFEMEPEKIEEIVPDICWKIGTFLGELGVYFVYSSDGSTFGRTIFQGLDAIWRTGQKQDPFVLLLIRRKTPALEICDIVKSHGGYPIFLDNLLSIDGAGFIRSNKKLQNLDALECLVRASSSHDGHNATTNAFLAFTNFDDNFRKKFPKVGDPMPLKVLSMKYKLRLTNPEIAKRCGCSVRTIENRIRACPKAIRNAYVECPLELKTHTVDQIDD
jgi:hypothetical protein